MRFPSRAATPATPTAAATPGAGTPLSHAAPPAAGAPASRLDSLSLLIGTAGHIDHGKSALVEALTGTHPDRLAEERRRGITIDLGFAHVDLPGADGRPVRLSFIDVPGHERFVRNMLAGAGGVDLALLVVAADESVKPQTREHFEICRLLGIRQGIVALTKSDLADAETLALVEAEVADLVRGSFLEGAPVIAVSAVTGAGLDRLKAALAGAAQRAQPRNAELPARLPLDRVFTLRGFGTVVTGTLLAGTIAANSELELLAGAGPGRRLRVRGVQVHGSAVAVASAGQRTAVNLAGVEPAELARGMLLAEPGVFRVTDRCDAALELLADAPPLKQRAPVHIHALSAETIAHVTFFDRARLAPGSTAYAHLRLAAPLPLVPGDRFIVRQFSPLLTIGGGHVVATFSSGRRDPDQVEQLAALDRAGAEERLALLAARAGGPGLALPDLAAAVGQRPGDLRPVLQRMDRARQLVFAAERVLGPAQAAAWQAALIAALEAFHAAEPLAPGIGAEALGGRLPPPRRAGLGPLYRALLERLVATGQAEIAGERVRLRGREVTLTAAEAQAQQRIEAAFRAAGLRSPAVGEVLAQAQVDPRLGAKILQLLVRDQTLVKVSEELILHRDALAGLQRQLAERKARAPRLSVPEFKALTGVSRKYAIPLLEYLDRARVTRRQGDEREIL